MIWIIIAVSTAIVLLFIFNRLRTRCPLCGKLSMNKKISNFKSEDSDIADIQSQLSELMKSDPDSKQFAKDPNQGFANDYLQCKNCSHQFDRQAAMIWQKTANKLGEDKAIDEYKKLKQ